ncbi:hypothetical protein [Dokdonella soli]|uniref:Cobalamin ABC transporter n=1 Tax=Dokdonella soli TaxID=529810 RepID=A0ABN1IVX7_9GAMM
MNTANPSLSNIARAGILLILALVMLATRINHFGALPDASWAVFFVAGFYLRGSARWAFPALMALAVLIDFFVITSQGINFWSHYCVSPAYWFLVPSYGALWFGGSWLRQRYAGLHARELGLLIGSAAVAASVCYLVSNGSFYWISASVPARSFAGWMENLGDWYLPYLRTTLMYVGIATVLHALTEQALRWMPTQAGHAARR